MSCERCGIPITEANAKRFPRAWSITSCCDSCHYVVMDDLAWLTGTGRFAQ